MRATLLSFLLVLGLALLAAGCGDSNSGSGSDDTGSGDTAGESTGDDAATVTEHIDGTAKVEGEQLVLSPKGRAPITFDLGEDVELAELRALETTGGTVRVTYEPARGDANAVALRVQPVEAHEGQKTDQGKIVSVDAKQLVLDGAAGETTYPMGIADEHEIDHLAEHAANGEPVKVFLSDEGAVVAYEDA